MKSCPVPGIDPYQEEILQVSNKKKRIGHFWQLLAEKIPQSFFEMLEIFYKSWLKTCKRTRVFIT